MHAIRFCAGLQDRLKNVREKSTQTTKFPETCCENNNNNEMTVWDVATMRWCVTCNEFGSSNARTRRPPTPRDCTHSTVCIRTRPHALHSPNWSPPCDTDQPANTHLVTPESYSSREKSTESLMRSRDKTSTDLEHYCLKYCRLGSFSLTQEHNSTGPTNSCQVKTASRGQI